MNIINLDTLAADRETLVEWFAEQNYTDYVLEEKSESYTWSADTFFNVTIPDDNVAVAFKLKFECKMGRRKSTAEIIDEMATHLRDKLDDQFKDDYSNFRKEAAIFNMQFAIQDYLDIIKRTSK
jgi:hypothetical protein